MSVLEVAGLIVGVVGAAVVLVKLRFLISDRRRDARERSHAEESTEFQRELQRRADRNRTIIAGLGADPARARRARPARRRGPKRPK